MSTAANQSSTVLEPPVLEPTVLAIETSCDETAVAIVRGRQVLSSVVASQIDIHRRYGGVVPEVASREHVGAIGTAISQSFELADPPVSWQDIDAIATTCAPGLVGALMVGITAAKTLAMIHHKPFLGVHHLEGHIYASYLSDDTLEPPFLCLLVSGGHTSFVQVRGAGDYVILGKTRDDAAGEAFDKVARLLDLGYPGGPVIDRLAQQGNAEAFPLPEGKISLPDGGFHPYDASFSGLKTAVLRLTEKLKAQGLSEKDLPEKDLPEKDLPEKDLPEKTLSVDSARNASDSGELESSDYQLPIADIAASFQATVVRSLVKRAIACATDYQLSTIVVGGGVAANSGLRQQLQLAAEKHALKVIFPPMKYCTDNAAMIACAAAAHFAKGERSPLTLGAQSKLSLTEISQLYTPSQTI